MSEHPRAWLRARRLRQSWLAVCAADGTPRCFTSITDRAPHGMDHPRWVCASSETNDIVDIGDPELVITLGPDTSIVLAFHDTIEVTDGHVRTTRMRPPDTTPRTDDVVTAEQEPIGRGLCNDHDWCPSNWQAPRDDF